MPPLAGLYQLQGDVSRPGLVGNQRGHVSRVRAEVITFCMWPSLGFTRRRILARAQRGHVSGVCAEGGGYYFLHVGCADTACCRCSVHLLSQRKEL